MVSFEEFINKCCTVVNSTYVRELFYDDEKSLTLWTKETMNTYLQSLKTEFKNSLQVDLTFATYYSSRLGKDVSCRIMLYEYGVEIYESVGNDRIIIKAGTL